MSNHTTIVVRKVGRIRIAFGGVGTRGRGKKGPSGQVFLGWTRYGTTVLSQIAQQKSYKPHGP